MVTRCRQNPPNDRIGREAAWPPEEQWRTPRGPRCRRPRGLTPTPNRAPHRRCGPRGSSPPPPPPGRDEEDTAPRPRRARPAPGAADRPPGREPGQPHPPGGGRGARLDTQYEHLRHAALHARATAFPLGLGVLIGKGVTAWRRTLAHLTSTTTHNIAESPSGIATGSSPTPLPDSVAADLVHALAGLAVALAA